MTAPGQADGRASVLALHHGYRVAGGEERAAAQLADVAEQRLGERVFWLRRDSNAITAGDAARGLLGGGTAAQQVTDAFEQTGADLLHAHNLFPTFGPAALRAARNAGAAIVVHLHNYRLVCSVAVNVRDGRDCISCRAGNPLPGLVHRCRPNVVEGAVYAAALPRWQRSIIQLADVIVVPSAAARTRLGQLGIRPRGDRMFVVGGVTGPVATHSTASSGRYALAVSRLAPEKDLITAITACNQARIPLVIAGDGPELGALQRHASRANPPHSLDPAAVLGPALMGSLPNIPMAHGGTIFVGRVGDDALRALRAAARVGLAPSLAHETFGLAALESMAAGLPTIGSAVGALPELLGDEFVCQAGDAGALASKITVLAGDDAAGVAAAKRAQALASADVVAERLRAAYDSARDQAITRRAYGHARTRR